MMTTLKQIIGFLREREMIDEAHAERLDKLPDAPISGFSPISQATTGSLSWMRSQQLDFSAVKAVVVICARDFEIPQNTLIAFIPVTNPRLAFIRVLRQFGPQTFKKGVDPTAEIGADCKLGEGVSIGAYSVIGDNVVIGDRTEIRHHVVIADNTQIGADCVIKSHAAIGEEGFGFENDEAGHPVHMPHIGRVIIGDDVYIGNFVTVIRGSLGDTRIGDHVKIDDHVHIAHNVLIGNDTIITACAELSGGVDVGKNVWLAPNCSIVQKIKIGDDAFIAIGAVVTKDIEPNMVAMGSPARSIKKRFEDK